MTAATRRPPATAAADWTELVGRILAGVPALPNAACRGQSELFDPANPGEDELHVARRHAIAVDICATCPVLQRCRAWVDTLPPNARPAGVIAGQTPPPHNRRRTIMDETPTPGRPRVDLSDAATLTAREVTVIAMMFNPDDKTLTPALVLDTAEFGKLVTLLNIDQARALGETCRRAADATPAELADIANQIREQGNAR